MGIDPVTVAGLVANILQFVDFSCKLIGKAREIHNSTNGGANEIISLEKSTEDLVALDSLLRSSLRPQGVHSALTEKQQHLEDTRARCMEIASTLLEALCKLKTSGSPRKWKSLRMALQTIWGKEKIQLMERQLAALKHHLTMNMVIATNHDLNRMEAEQNNSLAALSQRAVDIDSTVTKISTQITAALDHQNTLGETLSRQIVESISWKLQQSQFETSMTLQRSTNTLRPQLKAYFDRFQAELGKEVQDLHYKIDHTLCERLLVVESLVANQQTNRFVSKNYSVDEDLGRSEIIYRSKTNDEKMKGRATLDRDINAAQCSISDCIRNCSCVCHSSRRILFPSLVTPYFGLLSITLTGPLRGYQPCNETRCLRRSLLRTQITYRFPPWLFARILRVYLGFPGDGLTASLRVNKVVPDDAEIMDLVKAGDLAGVQSLLERRLASPDDVNYSCEVPILSYAVQGHHADLCRFLLQNGANPCHENRLSISALDMAWRLVLNKGLDSSTEKNFREVFSMWYDSVWIEDQRFLPLHKIVLEFVDANLVSNLDISTSTINDTDSKGNTPLAWAAARGDESALRTLLEYGANPNSICVVGNTPLVNAVFSQSPVCVLPLLQYGASTEHKNHLHFTPLHYAAYYRDDEDYLTPLLDFGAKCEDKDVYGWTALACAADRNNPRSAIVLLDRGANMESQDTDGLTPLLRSVSSNSHGVLRLLLQRGANCRASSFKGQNILHLAAVKGNLGTLDILTKASLTGLDVNAKSDDGLTATELLSKREFKAIVLGSAFAELLESVAGVETQAGLDGFDYFECSDDDTSSSDTFADALEY